MLTSLLKKFRPTPNIASIEPLKPIIKTNIPGPESRALLNNLETLTQDFRTVRFFTDYEKSAGNFIADADGNLILDANAQSSSLPIGYNHPDFVEYLKTTSMSHSIIHRSACGLNPPEDWPEKLRDVLMPLAPEGLNELFNSCGCGTGANENALKAAFLWYYKNQNGSEPTEEQLKTTMEGKAPGVPNYVILSHAGASHGKLLGTLSASSASAEAKLDFPAFNWPTVPFPKLKYPLENFIENKGIEAQALEETRNLFKNSQNPIAGIIFEPIMNDGNYFASKWYYQQLQNIAKEYKAAVIVDETNVGFGASGKLWCHEHFGIKPDIMTFSKKAQVSGYFCKKEFRPAKPYQIMNTWCGDPLRLQLLEGVYRIVKEDELIAQAGEVGDYILKGLMKIQERKGKISNIRGIGLHIGFDMPNKEMAGNFYRNMLNKGVHIGISKENVIQLRPSLIFEKKHADIFLEATAETL